MGIYVNNTGDSEIEWELTAALSDIVGILTASDAEKYESEIKSILDTHNISYD